MTHSDPATEAYYADKRLFRRNAFWFVFGNVAVAFGMSTVMALMPLHLKTIGMDPGLITTIMAFSGWISVPIMLYVANLSDHWQWKWGRRLPFILFSLPVMVLATFLFPFTNSTVSALAVYLLFQASFQLKYAVFPYLMREISPGQFLGRITGITAASSGLANWGGAVFLMPMLRTHGEITVFWICGGFILVATALTLTFVREPPTRSEQGPEGNPLKAMLRTLRGGINTRFRAVVALAFTLAGGINITGQLIALQGVSNLGIEAADIGVRVLQYGTVATIVLSIFSGALVDRLGSAAAVAVGAALMLCAAALGFRPDIASGMLGFDAATILAAAWVLALSANAFVYLAATVFQLKCVPRDEVATFCSSVGVVNMLVSPVFLFLTGQLITRVFHGNYGAAFLVSAAMVLLTVPLYLRLARAPEARPDSGGANG
jgi:Na+/melibiose symporter-like transporter